MCVLFVGDGIKHRPRRISDWKGIREKAGEVNKTEASVPTDHASLELSTGVTLVQSTLANPVTANPDRNMKN
jgi:hypothetical protein